MTRRARMAACFLAAAMARPAHAQSPANLTALRGLAPVARLLETREGGAALAANLAITGGIQTGTLKQPLLLPFPEQQRQALRDAFITGGNASGLADGLGTTLGPLYQDRARYGTPKDFTNVSPGVAKLIAYANETTEADSGVAKHVFGDGTLDGKTPLAGMAGLLAGGTTDVFGKAYGVAGRGGDPRPFLTEPRLAPIAGDDYFGRPSSNFAHLRGPAQDLTDSPSYPSGHTAYGVMESLLLAILVPERYGQEIARGVEYGNDRIILGAHYAMDVIAGRALAYHDMAHLLANDPAYVGRPRARAAVIGDFQAATRSARAEVTAVLEKACGGTLRACAAADAGRFRDPAADAALVAATLTYGLPVVHRNTAGVAEDVGAIAPEAGYLLTTAFPRLTLAQADAILTATEGPGGGFLDDGSAFGLYSRLDLFAAAARARARQGVRQRKREAGASLSTKHRRSVGQWFCFSRRSCSGSFTWPWWPVEWAPDPPSASALCVPASRFCFNRPSCSGSFT